EATKGAMRDVGGPVVAIALVLAAVFVPVAFLGGLTGQLYKQFALTLAVSVILSAICALTFTPAMCALLLRRVDEAQPHHGPLARFLGGFNPGFNRSGEGFGESVAGMAGPPVLVVRAFWRVAVAVGVLNSNRPTGLGPAEGQGFRGPNGQVAQAAALERTNA